MLRRIALLLAVLLTTVSAVSQTSAQDAVTTNALVRVVHVAPGAPAVDVYADDVLLASNLAFATATPYIRVPAGARVLTITATGDSATLATQSVTVDPGVPYTLVAATTDPLTLQVFPDNLDPLALGNARLTAIHAVDSAPAVDLILSDGRPVASGLSFGAPYGTLDVPAFAYLFNVTPAGGGVDAALLDEPFLASLDSGTSTMLVLYGTPDDVQVLPLVAPAQAEPGTGFARFVHALNGAPAVDIYVDDTLVAPSVAASDGGTLYLPLPTGERTVAVRAANGADVLLSGTLEVAERGYLTAIVGPSADAAQLTVFADDLTSLAVNAPVLTLYNVSGEADAALAFDSDALLSAAANESSAAPFIPVDSALLAVVGDDTFDLVRAPLYGGVVYSVVVADATEPFTLLPYSLAAGLGSAPGAGEVVVADAPAQATPDITNQTPQPPAIATTEATQPPGVAVQPTQALDVVTARVILDPGANLNLRQFPSTDALVLGSAPSGATLTVLGRQGPPTPPVDATPDPEATPFEDPAAALEGNTDLPATATWLNVTYNTPDGGQIDAWVLAQFLDVRAPNGNRQRLADLPLTPEDRAGVARNTAVTPPPVVTPVLNAQVIGLDVGVNLNVRRTPASTGEVIARLPIGTEVQVRGWLLPAETDLADATLADAAAAEWVFVSFTSPQGGLVTGWLDTDFVTYRLNARAIAFDEISTRGLLAFVSGTTRGDTRAATTADAPPPRPTADPLRNTVVATVVLDPGANLQFRRSPSVNAASLGLIPSGAQLPVLGRSENSAWLLVEFQGSTGWVAARYVRLTLNGATAPLEDVLVVEGVEGAEVPNYGAPVPTTPGAPGAPATPPPAGGGEEPLFPN